MVETIISLRKKAKALGIKDVSSYTKDDLKKKIEELEAQKVEEVTEAPETVDEAEAMEADEAEVQKKIEEGEVEEISEEEARNLPKSQKRKSSKKKELTKKAVTTKKEKAEEPAKKEKAPKVKKCMVFSYKLKKEYEDKTAKDLKLGEVSTKVFNLLKDGKETDSIHKISKKLNTYYSVVSLTVSKYFDITKEEKVLE